MSIDVDYNHGYQDVNNLDSLTFYNFGNSLDVMTMGQRLRERRTELGWSQADVVERMVRNGWAISQPAVNKIEGGGGTGMVVEIAAVLGLSALWLKTGDGPRLVDMANTGVLLYDASISDSLSLSLSEVHVPPMTVSIPLTRDLRDIDVLDSGRMRMRPGTTKTHFKTDFILSDNAVAYQLTDGLLDPVFEIGTVFVFDPAVTPKARRPVLVDIAGTVAVRLYRPLFGDVYELYTPSGALGTLRSDQAPIKILAGMLRLVFEDEQSRQ